jgi:hypothetical protein
MSLQRLPGRRLFRARRQETRPARDTRDEAVAAGGAERETLRQEYGRAMCDSLLTPWFAVGAGLLVAASLTLISPHAALTFPRSTGTCGQPRCWQGGTTTPGQAEPLVQRQLRIEPRAQGHLRAETSPIAVRYRLLVRRRAHFMAVILISSSKPLGEWTLRFDFPGIHVDSVMWATWAPDGSGGLILSGAPMPWPRSANGQARIVIAGTGNPRWPRHCVIDNAPCAFRQLPGP